MKTLDFSNWFLAAPEKFGIPVNNWQKLGAGSKITDFRNFIRLVNRLPSSQSKTLTRKWRCYCHIGEYVSSGCSLIHEDRDLIYLLHTTKYVTDQTKAHRLFLFTPKSNPIPYFSKTPKQFKERLGSWHALTSIKTKQTNPSHMQQNQKTEQLYHIATHKKLLIHCRNVNYYIYM